jgi:hypothetical protein
MDAVVWVFMVLGGYAIKMQLLTSIMASSRIENRPLHGRSWPRTLSGSHFEDVVGGERDNRLRTRLIDGTPIGD